MGYPGPCNTVFPCYLGSGSISALIEPALIGKTLLVQAISAREAYPPSLSPLCHSIVSLTGVAYNSLFWV